mgnify:CR=1 FL=1
MIDIELIRKDAGAVREALLKRMERVDFEELLEWDTRRRSAIGEVDSLKARRNAVSKEIPAMKKRGEGVEDLIVEMRGVGERIKEIDRDILELDDNITRFLAELPNIPAPGPS